MRTTCESRTICQGSAKSLTLPGSGKTEVAYDGGDNERRFIKMALTHVAVNSGNRLVAAGPGPRPEPDLCRGNLLQNGGFESGLCGWERRNAMVVTGAFTHSGRRAAALGPCGRNRRRAFLWQRVRLPSISHGAYLLSFHLSGRRRAPAPVGLRLTWLDAEGRELGDGLKTFIQPRAVGAAPCGQWTSFAFASDGAPADAVFVRVAFFKGRGCRKGNFLLIDDVLLTAIATVC